MYNSIPTASTARRRFTALFAAIALLVFALAFGAAAPAKAETTSSTASVAFIEGDLIIITDPDGSGLDFDFGSHYLPTTEVSYPAENQENHILSVEDGRTNNGNWYVTVGLSKFAESGESPSAPEFDAMINLKNPDVYNENNTIGTTGLTHAADIKVSSGGAPQLVMEADSSLQRGRYSAEWTNANVTLNISDTDVPSIQLTSYTATVSWSLNIGPR